MTTNLSIIKDLGIHELFEYKKNNKGEIIKTIKKSIRRYSIPVKKYEAVEQRKAEWVKFGKATNEDNSKVTFLSTEEVFMEPPSPKNGKNNSTTFVKNDEMMKCRHCDHNHWTRLCPTLEENKKDEKNHNKYKDEKEKYKDFKDKGKNSYEKKVYTESSKTTKTIIIQNLSKDVKEYDLHELLSSSGCHIYKIFIPKDYQSGDSRGMAFIDVGTIEEANYIISRYNDFGINHLRIKVSLV